jgi:molybdopterin synthase catalytic subunit
MALIPETSIDARLLTDDGICAITHEALNTDEIVKSVGDGSAGAIAVFIGTTRNTFKGE